MKGISPNNVSGFLANRVRMEFNINVADLAVEFLPSNMSREYLICPNEWGRFGGRSGFRQMGCGLVRLSLRGRASEYSSSHRHHPSYSPVCAGGNA